MSNKVDDIPSDVKTHLEQKYQSLIQNVDDRDVCRVQLEEELSRLNLDPEQKEKIRIDFEEAVKDYEKEKRRRYSRADFTPLGIIGRGAFGEIQLVRMNETGDIFAMKILSKDEMIRRKKVAYCRTERDALVDAIQDFSNPWVCKLHYSFQDADNLYMVMDFLNGGDLMTWLIDKDIFTVRETQFYIAQLVSSIDSIHKMGYAHRDIKPDNLLLDRHGHMYLSDFGLARVFDAEPDAVTEWAGAVDEHGNIVHSSSSSSSSGSSSSMLKGAESVVAGSSDISSVIPMSNKHRRRDLMYSTVGTPGYIAPEVLQKKGYGQEADWWSVGIIMFECLYGYAPFSTDDPVQTCRRILKWKKTLRIPEKPKTSPEAIDLILKLLTDADVRLGRNGGEEVKSHPFFDGIDWEILRTAKPPFDPRVVDQLDTHHFEDFRPITPPKDPSQLLSPGPKFKNKEEELMFMGFTYKKNPNPRPALSSSLFAGPPK